MLVTLDTNVLVQALASVHGALAKIVDDILTYKFNMALSVSVFNEYEDVLSRVALQEKLGFTPGDIPALLTSLLRIGKRQKIHYLWRPNLKDEKDNLFVELAVASQSEYLIASNTRDFIGDDLKMQSFQVVTPAEFIKIWRLRNE